VDRHPVCSQCWARYACGGGCRQENFLSSGDIRVLNPDTCGYQQGLLEAVLRLLGRTGGDYRSHDRSQLEDLFVSCGRPVVPNGRVLDDPLPQGLRHFRPLSARGSASRPVAA
ncbi:MAG TPA: hypothetical protein PK413_06270, partial [Thermoanaerobaculia bacterium]|nr:hypothetical protein [Thermoanaerobaculia bacterium]